MKEKCHYTTTVSFYKLELKKKHFQTFSHQRISGDCLSKCHRCTESVFRPQELWRKPCCCLLPLPGDPGSLHDAKKTRILNLGCLFEPVVNIFSQSVHVLDVPYKEQSHGLQQENISRYFFLRGRGNESCDLIGS